MRWCITKIGASVSDLKPGDPVYCQSFAKFGNFVRDKASFCQKLQPEDTFEAVATIPLAFCTAIYGLVNLGRLDRGETAKERRKQTTVIKHNRMIELER